MKNEIFGLEKRQDFWTEIILFSMFQVIVPDEQEPDCKIVNQCSPYGECVKNLQTQDFECKCLPGFKENGIQCEPIGKALFRNSEVYA